jgi:afadin
LNWHKDDREGRFLLRRIDEVSQIGAMMTTAAAAGDGSHSSKEGPEFKRKLSKREKKEMKKQVPIFTKLCLRPKSFRTSFFVVE